MSKNISKLNVNHFEGKPLSEINISILDDFIDELKEASTENDINLLYQEFVFENPFLKKELQQIRDDSISKLNSSRNYEKGCKVGGNNDVDGIFIPEEIETPPREDIQKILPKFQLSIIEKIEANLRSLEKERNDLQLLSIDNHEVVPSLLEELKQFESKLDEVLSEISQSILTTEKKFEYYKKIFDLKYNFKLSIQNQDQIQVSAKSTEQITTSQEILDDKNEQMFNFLFQKNYISISLREDIGKATTINEICNTVVAARLAFSQLSEVKDSKLDPKAAFQDIADNGIKKAIYIEEIKKCNSIAAVLMKVKNEENKNIPPYAVQKINEIANQRIKVLHDKQITALKFKIKDCQTPVEVICLLQDIKKEMKYYNIYPEIKNLWESISKLANVKIVELFESNLKQCDTFAKVTELLEKTKSEVGNADPSPEIKNVLMDISNLTAEKINELNMASSAIGNKNRVSSSKFSIFNNQKNITPRDNKTNEILPKYLP